jgi:hypothetical protein
MKRCWKAVALNAVVTAALAMGVSAPVARAVQVYAVDNLGPTNAGTVGDRLIRFDTSNPLGTMTVIGATGVAGVGMSGLDFSGDGSTLYAVGGFNTNGTSFSGSELYKINPNTGAATVVGNMDLDAGEAATDLSWNPITHEMQVLTYNGTTNWLYDVDLGSGQVYGIGQITGLKNGVALGLATDAAGINYIQDVTSDEMYKLNGTAAVAMASPPFSFDSNYSQGMVIDWRNTGQWYWGSQGPTAAANGLYQISPGSGGVVGTSAIWPTDAGSGLPEYETGDLAIAPEPTSAAVVLTIAFGAGLRYRASRRRSSLSIS